MSAQIFQEASEEHPLQPYIDALSDAELAEYKEVNARIRRFNPRTAEIAEEMIERARGRRREANGAAP